MNLACKVCCICLLSIVSHLEIAFLIGWLRCRESRGTKSLAGCRKEKIVTERL